MIYLLIYLLMAAPFVAAYLKQERRWQGEAAWLDLQEWNRERGILTGEYLDLNTAEQPAIRRRAA